MADNLPDNLSDVEDEYIVGEDSRAMQLTHYVLAERLLQVEYAEIMSCLLYTSPSPRDLP